MSTKKINCVYCNESGNLKSVTLNYEKIHDFFGSEITFVGAIPELEIVAIASTDTKGEKNTHPFIETFEEDVTGGVLFVKMVGKDAIPSNITIEELESFISTRVLEEHPLSQ